MERLWAAAGGDTWATSPVTPKLFNAEVVLPLMGFRRVGLAPDYPSDPSHILSVGRQYATERRWLGEIRRPTLWHSFTTDGHFPFHNVGERMGRVCRSAEPACAWANIMADVATAVVERVQFVMQADPHAVVLVLGDHAPPLPAVTAGDLQGARAAMHGTPVLLFVDGKLRPLPAVVAHYELPYVVADLASDGAYCRANRCPDLTRPVVRPLADGVLSVSRDGSSAMVCRSGGRGDDWCRDLEAIAQGMRAQTARAAGLLP